MNLLEISKLTLRIGAFEALKGIDLSVRTGEIRALVGESGSGKSMTALSIMKLLPGGARTGGQINFGGKDLLTASEAEMCRLRGNEIGMVFQEPMTALNPVKTIGEQVAEGIRLHTGATRAIAEEQTRAILDRVGLPGAKFPLGRYPHELSGGQRQRVVIAIACALKPRLLIADEPTTALDVVLQAQILDLLQSLVDEERMGLLLISHDLAVVAGMAHSITVLRHGEVMDTGETTQILSEQTHPYTRQLAQASMHVPERTAHHLTLATPDGPLLAIRNLTRTYPGRRKGLFGRDPDFRAVDDVTFDIKPGQSTALVGRSGCGKSTLARMVLALDRPTDGQIHFAGRRIDKLTPDDLRPVRRNMQVVFQDPYGSFNPRHKAERLIAEPLYLLDRELSDGERRDRVHRALERVGIPRADKDKYPHEFSGGQRQRLAIARAIITEPKLIVADEPVSALDVSIRAQILDLFADLNDRLGIAYLFITHDLAVARAITDTVMVMSEGKIVERGKTEEILRQPLSEAGRALVRASPDLHKALARRITEQG
ncbi:dipeptide ABC transporter ATP-binding protein [Phyllobacterium calauticae]|jgi:peptide/nickel transport system ATP-binding protein|uniref:ABC transporter ATP-binding protein n=1 Tax=Phyllobacterium calauticae TaxID=2817027 RepID=UPI001CBEB240|nr:dipeptide ABC transporter ATP-binding protein [Phyllobacterium calauticae]MBZ3692637.1 ABC transporter ATP-binding protein [Phyllobacterium calauticae]